MEAGFKTFFNIAILENNLFLSKNAWMYIATALLGVSVMNPITISFFDANPPLPAWVNPACIAANTIYLALLLLFFALKVKLRTILVNLFTLAVMFGITDLFFGVLIKEKVFKTHYDFRLSRPEPYKVAPYFSADFIAEMEEHAGQFSPEGSNLVLPIDFSGKYYNVENNIRQTSFQPKTHDNIIYIFGGSTVYNSEVPDEHTLASYIQKRVNAENKRYKVINMGVTTVFSDQQFERLRGYVHIKPKDIIVFYDGINDALQRVYYQNKKGWLAGKPLMKLPAHVQLIQRAAVYSNIFSYFEHSMTKVIHNFEDLAPDAAKEYAKTIENSAAFAKSYDGLFFHFLQPHLFTKLKLSDYENNLIDMGSPFVYPRMGEALNVTYPFFKANLSSKMFSYDLTKIFDGVSTSPYVDIGHTTEIGNKILAEKIYEVIFAGNK
jgi:hypothetical protein